MNEVRPGRPFSVNDLPSAEADREFCRERRQPAPPRPMVAFVQMSATLEDLPRARIRPDVSAT